MGKDSSVASVDNWGGANIHISCSISLISFKIIVVKVCEHKYMNIRPSNYCRQRLRHWLQNLQIFKNKHAVNQFKNNYSLKFRPLTVL